MTTRRSQGQGVPEPPLRECHLGTLGAGWHLVKEAGMGPRIREDNGVGRAATRDAPTGEGEWERRISMPPRSPKGRGFPNPPTRMPFGDAGRGMASS